MSTIWLCHHGLNIRVKDNALEITYRDRSGPQRFVYYRGVHGIERILVYGRAGILSLDAIQWLNDQSIELYVIGTDNQLIAQLGATRNATVQLRLMQIDALQTGHAVSWTRWLLRRKIQGHQQIIDIPELNLALKRLLTASSIDECRMVEALAARAYWTSLEGLPISWKKTDLKKVPNHWLRMQGRNSGLRSNRNATDPVNALLNYGYAILEAETRIAAYTVGWDVDFGILHTSMEYRQSFIHDLMEPLRAQVDGWVFGWLSTQQLKYKDFLALPSGEVRMAVETAKNFSLGLSEALRPLCLEVAEEARYVLAELMGNSESVINIG